MAQRGKHNVRIKEGATRTNRSVERKVDPHMAELVKFLARRAAELDYDKHRADSSVQKADANKAG